MANSAIHVGDLICYAGIPGTWRVGDWLHSARDGSRRMYATCSRSRDWFEVRHTIAGQVGRMRLAAQTRLGRRTRRPG